METTFDFSAALDAEAREDFDMALSLYDAAVTHALTADLQGEALFHRGCLYFRVGDYENALRDLTKSLKLSPEGSPYLWEALMNRGMSLALTGDVQAAEADLVKSIELEPGNGVAYLNLAGVKIRLNDKQGAALCLNIAKTIFTQDEDEGGVEAVEGLLAHLAESPARA